jgi:hypothetical protein
MQSDLEVLKSYTAKFKTRTKAAESLSMSVQQLTNLLNGHTNIGAAIRERLQKVDAYSSDTVKQKPSDNQNLVKIVAEQNLYIKLLETDVKALKEKVESFEQYVNFTKRAET